MLFLGLIILVVLVIDTRQRLGAMRRELTELRHRIAFGDPVSAAPEPAAQPDATAPTPATAAIPQRAIARIIKTDLAPPEPVIPPAPPLPPSVPPLPEAPPAPPPKPALSFSEQFEAIVGGRLPIWIGGIAIIFAGIFLVRYSIEAGLLGPGVRSILAALLGLTCIALPEVARVVPKLRPLDEDPRVGQALSGAGVAILYGTLYMAAELYGLIGTGTAFVLLLLVTVLAFALALRRGPPTALLGLAGGYAAPLVAGLADDGLVPLLAYLTLFSAAMFGLAVWQRWRWLLLAASVINALWTGSLLFGVTAIDESPLGIAILLVALGGGAASLIMERDEQKGAFGWLATTTPLALGLLQLALLVPLLAPRPLDWMLYGLLGLATVALAWRRAAFVPLAGAALVLALAMLAASAATVAPGWLIAAAALGIAILFGGAGQARALDDTDQPTAWSLIAVVAPAGAMLAPALAGNDLLADRQWGLLALAATLPAALLAFRGSRAATGPALVIGSIGAVVMATIAAGWLVPRDPAASGFALIAAAAAFWAQRHDRPALRLIPLLPVLVAAALMAIDGFGLINAAGASLIGMTDFYNLLPPSGMAALQVALPGALLLVAAWFLWQGIAAPVRVTMNAIGGAALIGMAWLLAKQVFAIDTDVDFQRVGFFERTLITQAIAAAGFTALWYGREAPRARPFGITLGLLALFRLAWFDLAILNPLFVAQALGPAPIANLGTLHFGAAALWLYLYARLAPRGIAIPLQIGALLITAGAVFVTVRQFAHGSIIAGWSMGTGETYLHSAALLLLALVWLGAGLMRRGKLLRVSGLILLTLVTFKVFLVDAAALDGLLRVLSFLGLGLALIGIGWAYGRVMRAGTDAPQSAEEASRATLASTES